MKVLITGHCGFIGKHLCNTLQDKTIIGIDAAEGLNIMSRIDMRDAFSQEPDIVIHLAALTSVFESAQKPYKYFMNNGVGTYRVVDWANNTPSVKRVIYAATAASLEPYSSPYAFSKWVGELSLPVCEKETIALRFFNVVGEGQNKNYMGVVPKFKDLIKSRAPLTVYGDGEQTRDFVDVRDVVQAIILAMNVTPLSEKHTSFEIGSGRAVSVNHVVKALTKNKIGITVVHEPAKQEVRHSVANITEARKVLGYEPRYEVF